MAGGRGERLAPLTQHTPKPLLCVQGKSLLDHSIDYLLQYQISDITISIGYLGEQIQRHVKDTYRANLPIGFVEETSPLGTIGALRLMPAHEQPYTLVINADILTDLNLRVFFGALQAQAADLIVATHQQQVTLPYGVIEVSEQGLISQVQEKPVYTFQVNAGIYLFRTELIHRIPPRQRFDATDFLRQLISAQYKLVTWPITGYWFDAGTHDVYQRLQKMVSI